MGGRAGLAVAYATAPDAERLRGEIGRILLDLLRAGRAARLRSASELIARAGTLAAMQSPAAAPVAAAAGRRGKGTSTKAATVAAPTIADDPGGGEPTADADPAADTAGSRKVPAAERRRAVNLLLDAWRILARDLALAQAGAIRSVRDVALLEELEGAAAAAPAGAFAAFLGRLTRAGELVEGNVSPELVLDVLLVRWPVVGSKP